ncbi:MAG: type I-E CRISPR-associated protein Cse1/CasA [Fimbriimonas sp.]
MSRPTFDVLTEPWIPVIRLDGTREELGILPCLQNAHKVREIRDPSPIIEFGLYRLLVAFVLDALIVADSRPEDPIDLRELIQRGSFDEKSIQKYVQICGDVFDLFHPDRPFLQTVFSSKETESIAKLNPILPTAGAVHWHHFSHDSIGSDTKAAARELTSIAPFSPQGGRGYGTSPGGASSYYVVPLGNSLFETLSMNLPLVVPSEVNKLDTHGVPWRRTDDPVGRRPCATTLEGLTWRARRVHLRTEDGSLSKVVDYSFAQILTGEWRDPAVAYKFLSAKELEGRQKNAVKAGRASSEARSFDPIQATLGRAVWRDFAPLALLSTKHTNEASLTGQIRRPDVIDVASQVTQIQRILVVALVTDQANCDQWLRSCLPTPLNLADSESYAFEMHAEMQVAEDMAKLLLRSIQRLQPRSAKKKDKDLQKMLKQASQRAAAAFWIAMEGRYWDLVSYYSKRGSADQARETERNRTHWRNAAARVASEQFDDIANGFDSDADAFERQVKARVWLSSGLRKYLL